MPRYDGATGLTFGDAIEALKEGYRVAREGWNGQGAFLFLVPGSRFFVNRAPLNLIYPEGTEITYHAHIDMRTAQGYIVPWLASQPDILSEDWYVVEDAATELLGPGGEGDPIEDGDDGEAGEAEGTFE